MQGLGGGVLYTPIQVLFGVDFYEAATRSQLFIIVTSVSSMLIFRKAGKIDWPVALTLEAPAVTGGYLGGFYAQRFPEEGLLLVLALLVMMAALSMLRDLPPSQAGLANGSHWGVWRRRQGRRSYDVNLVQGLPVFFLIGVFSGLAGVAGGFLKIPVMALLFRMPMDVVLGCSAVMVSLTALGGLFGHLAAAGSWDWGPNLAAGGVHCRGRADRAAARAASRGPKPCSSASGISCCWWRGPFWCWRSTGEGRGRSGPSAATSNEKPLPVGNEALI